MYEALAIGKKYAMEIFRGRMELLSVSLLFLLVSENNFKEK